MDQGPRKFQLTSEAVRLEKQNPFDRQRKLNQTERIAIAAPHVILTNSHQKDHGDIKIDWEDTLNIRHYLWDNDFRVAEAMDTSQRGMGLPWIKAKLLIKKTLSESQSRKMAKGVVCGAGTDHVEHRKLRSKQAIVDAYREQTDWIEDQGGQCIIMASRSFTANHFATSAYVEIYQKVIERTAHPVILHWLGDMFDPLLRGYWGHTKKIDAGNIVLKIIKSLPEKIEGIKISLLDKNFEKYFRKLLPKNIRLFTGDDFNYPELIAGDENGYSDALLGILTAIAPVANTALKALSKGNSRQFFDTMNPTLPLSRKIFEEPTQNYKSGIAFITWINGIHKNLFLPNSLEHERSNSHYIDLFKLAAQANIITDLTFAEKRMEFLLKNKNLT